MLQMIVHQILNFFLLLYTFEMETLTDNNYSTTDYTLYLNLLERTAHEEGQSEWTSEGIVRINEIIARVNNYRHNGKFHHSL